MLRSNWKEQTSYSTNYNYKWQETNKRIEYCLLNKSNLNHYQTKVIFKIKLGG